jgi:hypothetical protein
LIEALGEFYPEAQWQRCVVHWYRNVFSEVPKAKVKGVAAMLKAIHAQEDRQAARRKAAEVVEKLEAMRLGKAATIVREGVDETLSYMAFPAEHWRQIRTNNPLERIMREIRRRTRVVGAFPDGRSALSFTCAVRSKAAAVLKKLVADRFTRHAISKTPGVIVDPSRSRTPSAGATLPNCGPCHQRRTILISPLMVRTLCDCRPLLASRLSVVGSCGGGKSGFRRIHPLLHGAFKYFAPHLRTKIAHLLLAAGDPLAIRRVVDGLHHLLGELLDLSLHRLGKLLRRYPWRRFHLVLLACWNRFVNPYASSLPKPRRSRQWKLSDTRPGA